MAIDVHVLQSEPHRLRMVVDGIDVATANAVRHALMGSVPVMAPDVVEVLCYNGQMKSEVVAHRIGLIPLRRKNGELPDAAATACFEVDVTWDKPTPGWVTSRDFKLVHGDVEMVHFRSPDEAARAKDDVGYPVLFLFPGQRAALRVTCRAGVGKEHVRWHAVYAHVTAANHDTENARSYEFVIETTGAVSPAQAWCAALQSVLAKLVRVRGM